MLRAFVVVVVSLFSVAALAADTLVVRGQDGSFAPGLAAAWRQDGDAVRFILVDGADPAVVATALSSSLAGAQIKTESKAVIVSGIAMQRLLEQVSAISVGGGDPLAGVSAMNGTQVAFAPPEAGGSIRAGKPTIIATLMPHDPTDRVQAEVVEVARGPFPSVALKLRVKHAAKTGPYAKQLSLDKTFNGVVAFTGTSPKIDMSTEANQRNAGAYYVQPHDLVYVHIVQLDKNGASIDWIERANPPAASPGTARSPQ
jgi:hypothetical protein